MNRWLVFLCAFGLGFGAVAQQITIGVLEEDLYHWQTLAQEVQKATGLRVRVDPYFPGMLQQLVTVSPFVGARFDVAEVLDDWLPGLAPRLLDLSPYAQELGGLVYYAGRPLGVRLPWRADGLAVIVAKTRYPAQAAQILGHLGPPGAPTVEPPKEIPLQVGPLVLKKSPPRPDVDGALEVLLSAVRQATPTGQVTPLGQLPHLAREAVSRVAQMVGIPRATIERDEVVVVVEPRVPVSPQAAGAREAVSSPLGLTKAVVPLGQLESFLSQMAGRAYVRLPYEPIPLAVTSEGTEKIGAAAYHAQGHRGAGVKIAVVDLGFQGLSASQGRGDLPYSVITRDFTGTGINRGYYHGTAVAEIVHDVAPDATLYLIKIGNEVDLDNAVSYCITEGVQVINHSLGWYNTNFYDGTGVIGDIVRRATGAGITWVQAAGNDALRHWEGSFSDGNGDGWLDTELTFSASAGESITLYLTWDGWPQTADDYDLFLYGPGGDVVASSTKTQAGTEEPTERVSTTAPQGGTYRVRIQLASGRPRRLELFSIYQDLFPNVSASSMPAPANAAEALTVGAINWRNYTTGPAESYSSRGPTNDGRQKPDLSAPDNVTTGVTYYQPFPGTSAAAPHVAGAIALLLSADPGLSQSALRSSIRSFCVAMGDQNTYGAGRLELRPPAVAQPDLVVDNITYSPATPAIGQTITFQVRVRNQGAAAAGAFVVRLCGQAASREGNVASLAAGASQTLTLQLALSQSPETFTATADARDQVAESNEGNNQRQVTVTALAALMAEAGGPYSGQVGQPITFDGRGSQGPIAEYRWDFGDGFSDSGAVVTHVYSVPRTYTATLTVRATDGRTATDTAQVTVAAVGRPDLVIDRIDHSPATPAIGQTITFQVRVRNQGATAAGAFRVRLQGAGGPQDSYLTGLGAGASHTVTLQLPLSQSPETFTATADYLNQVAEADETNNTRQVTITAGAPALSFSISLDRPSYTVGDPIFINVNLSRTSYVYLVELDPLGRAFLIFPNRNEPDPGLPAGTTQLPRRGTFRASEPTGPEELVGFAADRPIPLFPTSFPIDRILLSDNGAAFLFQVRAWLSGNVPAGAWAEARAALSVGPAANLPPVAQFTYAPASPGVNQWITFDATGSHDPDGRVVSHSWDFGDGARATGPQVSKRYSSPGNYTVTLTVQDDRGATGQSSTQVVVSEEGAPSVLPGMPAIDKPGIYVWGTDRWHITVAGDTSWPSPRKFQITLETTGMFTNLACTPAGPTLRPGQRVVWNGEVGTGWVDLAFDLSGATSMQLTLYLDTDGDGVPKPRRAAQAKEMVFLRRCKTNPPGNPFVIFAPRGATAVLPGMNFRIGVCSSGRYPNCTYITWNIESREEEAGCR